MNIEQEGLIKNMIKHISECSSLEELEQIRVDLLGKQGLITQQFISIKKAPLSEFAELGKKINLLKAQAVDLIAEKKTELEDKKLCEEINQEWTDLTIVGKPKPLGRIHPISQAKKEILEILSSFGFIEEKGPNIEDEWHNFSALNMPLEHPARQMFDTFYLKNNKSENLNKEMLLRTHTSNVQIRVMNGKNPPFSFMSAGRVYRKDSDATHTPMFHQIEGVLVNDDCTFAHMKFLLTELVQRFFGPDVKMRLRPSFFPFTSPSAEIDIKIPNSQKWLEVMGLGMIHETVFRHCGIKKGCKGFAFGLGIERFAMIKYNIQDLRHMFESDQRWLQHNGFGIFGYQMR
jgi:phenylalanyl-tRNA synthetase alpha chain